MAQIYYKLILAGKKTIADVPDVNNLRDEVQTLLAQVEIS